MILDHHSVQQALCNGLSVVDLFSGQIHFTEEFESQDILLKCDNILSMHFFHKLWNYEQRLNYLVEEENSILLTFRTFIEYGASSYESVVLKKSLETISKFVQSFAGDIDTSWKSYTSPNGTFGSIEFLPDLFVEPLQDKMYFMNEMVKTQLFVSYVEEKMNLEQSNDGSDASLAQIRIARWVSKRWKNRSANR